jgi:hypothetical protein
MAGWQRIRLWLTNGFIAGVLVTLLLDMTPQAPPALHAAIQPTLVRLGINQGPWSLFAPDPDDTNMRVLVEITYRDGRQAEWTSPQWRQLTPWQRWSTSRRMEWIDHITAQWAAPVWQPWCRRLAQEMRPELEHAERGASVRVIYEESKVPPASERPWRSFRSRMEPTESSVLFIEQFE